MASFSRYKFPIFALLLAVPQAAPALALKQASMAEYAAHLESLRALVLRCQTTAAACNPEQVGDDDLVTLAGLGSSANLNQFEARYDWLRNTIRAASNAKAKDREADLAVTAVRLETALGEAGEQPEPSRFADARQKADGILSRPEFVTVNEQSIWEKLLARFFLWLDSFFTGLAKIGRRSPWIGPLLEWVLISLALIGLALWAMRALRRQRLAVRVETSRQIESWEEASRNWRNLAEERAARQEWREAIHCLYWASIVMLEGRRSWSPNRSRTPREYVSLLEPGSQRSSLLRQQTRGFERIWYGLNPADANDYRNALELHEQLRTA